MDDILSQAMQKKHDDSERAMDLFKQMHQIMHDEMEREQKPKEETPMVRLQSSPIPS